MTALGIVLHDLFMRQHGKASAFRPDELILAAARVLLSVVQVPLAKTAQGKILTQQGVEGEVDVSNKTISDKDDGVEAFKDHANLGRRVPAVIAS